MTQRKRLPGSDETLLNPNNFPLLTEALSRWVARGHSLDDPMPFLADQAMHLPFGKRDGAFTLATQHLGWELRAYLWYLFRAYDVALMASMSYFFEDLKWFARIASALCERFRLVIVSYNYDRAAERLFSESPRGLVAAHPEVSVDAWLNHSSSESLVLKPHGCVSMPAVHIGVLPIGWWLRDQMLSWDSSTGFRKAPHLKPLPPHCDFFPDIVPPGHGSDHLADPNTDVRRAVRLALRDADVIVNWGFSMAPPDDTEIGEDCSLIANPRPTTAMIALDDPRSRIARSQLGKIGQAPQFFDASVGMKRLAIDFVDWLSVQRPVKPRPLGRRESLQEMAGPYAHELKIADRISTK